MVQRQSGATQRVAANRMQPTINLFQQRKQTQTTHHSCADKRSTNIIFQNLAKNMHNIAKHHLKI